MQKGVSKRRRAGAEEKKGKLEGDGNEKVSKRQGEPLYCFKWGFLKPA